MVGTYFLERKETKEIRVKKEIMKKRLWRTLEKDMKMAVNERKNERNS